MNKRKAALQIARDIIAFRNAHIGKGPCNDRCEHAYEKAQRRRIKAIESLGLSFYEIHEAALRDAKEEDR